MHPINVLLFGIFIIMFLFTTCKQEGFNDIKQIDHLGGGVNGSIPAVPQDVVCMILSSMGVPINRMGILKDKCKYNVTELKDDDSTCPI